jgi:hypothetical protein
LLNERSDYRGRLAILDCRFKACCRSLYRNGAERAGAPFERVREAARFDLVAGV